MSLYLFLGILVLILGAINLMRMALFMIGSDIYGLKQYLKNKKPQSGPLPTFSVIIPAHNEEHTILRCMESVVASHYPYDSFQIIVADDGSTDQTVRLVKKYKKENDLNFISVVSLPHGGKARALNAAISKAKGELTMCLDADSTVEPDALAKAAAHFQNPSLVALAANVKIIDDGSLLSLIQFFEYLICYQMKRAQTVFNVEYIIGGIGSTFRRTMLTQIGFYDTNTVTEDIDLTMKIIRQGNKEHRVAYGADVVVHTEAVKSIGGLIRQRFRWKYGRCQTFWKNYFLFFNSQRKYSRLLTWGYLPFAIFSDLTFLLEPLVVGFLLFITIWFRDPWTLLTAISLISVYIALNILAEDTISWKKKMTLLPLVPTMYIFFYTLSFVEYLALLKSIPKIFMIPRSLRAGICSWEHASRSTTLNV